MTIPRNALLGGGVLAVALAFACTERPDPVAPEFWTTGSATHATSYSGRATVVQAEHRGLHHRGATTVAGGVGGRPGRPKLGRHRIGALGARERERYRQRTATE